MSGKFLQHTVLKHSFRSALHPMHHDEAEMGPAQGMPVELNLKAARGAGPARGGRPRVLSTQEATTAILSAKLARGAGGALGRSSGFAHFSTRLLNIIYLIRLIDEPKRNRRMQSRKSLPATLFYY